MDCFDLKIFIIFMCSKKNVKLNIQIVDASGAYFLRNLKVLTSQKQKKIIRRRSVFLYLNKRFMNMRTITSLNLVFFKGIYIQMLLKVSVLMVRKEFPQPLNLMLMFRRAHELKLLELLRYLFKDEVRSLDDRA